MLQYVVNFFEDILQYVVNFLKFYTMLSMIVSASEFDNCSLSTEFISNF